jgi:hypothetical protein
MTPVRQVAPRVLAAALCLVPLAASAQSPSELRQELDTVAVALDRAVRQVSRAGSFAVSGQTTRAYALPGVGAVFVLPARALPVRRAQSAADRQAAHALADARANLERSLRAARTPERRAQVERSLEAVRQAQVELQRRARPATPAIPAPPAAPVMPPVPPSAPVAPVARPGPEEEELLLQLPPLHELAAEVEAQLAAQANMLRELEQESRRAGLSLAEQYQAEVRALHAQADAFRREAERAREEAERAVRDQLDAASAELAGAPPQSPAAPTASAVPAPPPPAAALAAPPWSFWFEYEEGAEFEDAENVVGSVRDAVVLVLEAQGSRLTRVAPADSVVVAVDFVARGAGVAPRTLVLRVRKKDLDERKAGRLGAEEFQRRVEVTEY